MQTENLMLAQIYPSIRNAEFIADNLTLCKDDTDELAALGKTPRRAIFECCTLSQEIYVGFLDGDICGICGLGRSPFTDVPFMLSNGLAQGKYPRQFLEISNMFDKECLSKSVWLENYCSEHNRRSIAWLKWMGFEFEKKCSRIVNRVGFYRFWRYNHV